MGLRWAPSLLLSPPGSGLADQSEGGVPAPFFPVLLLLRFVFPSKRAARPGLTSARFVYPRKKRGLNPGRMF